MIFIIVAALLSYGPWVCAAGATAGCGHRLDDVAIARLHITPDVLTSALEQDPRLMRSLLHVVDVLDERTLDQIAIRLIDDPAVREEDRVAENPFYAARPDLRRRYGDQTLILLRGVLSDRLDPFEIGLLSYLIPDLPRAQDNRAALMDPMSVGRNRRERVEAVVQSEVYRPLLIDFMRRTFSLQTLNGARHIARLCTSEQRLWDFDDHTVREVLAHVAKGRVSRRDSFVITNFVDNCINDNLRRVDRSSLTTVRTSQIGFTTGKSDIISRANVVQVLDEHLGEVLSLSDSVDRYAGMLTAIAALDPLPVKSGHLLSVLTARASALLTPFLPKTRATTTSSPRPIDPARITPLRLRPTDHFAPGPQSRRRERTAVAPTSAAPVAPAWRPADIAPARRLHDFTTYAGVPRHLNELRSDLTYDFWYIRDARPTLRRVRFGPRALAFVREQPTAARQTINALHMGESRGSLSGIKHLTDWTSRRYDGPLYEVKIHEKYRALMILVDGVWQILRFSEKGQIEADVRWLSPLDELKIGANV